jgi:Domain of unknown function (DUF4276)
VGEERVGGAAVTRLLVLVEGQSEEVFVKRTLAPHLSQYDVHAIPTILWTKKMPPGGGHRGGVSSWTKIWQSLAPLTRDGDAWVTTLLDYYGLPADFPGVNGTLVTADPMIDVLRVQGEFRNTVNSARFIPFLALHEFEAWLFCDPDIAAAHFGAPDLAVRLRKVVADAGGPEYINHGVDTHPKARLRSLAGGYKETADAPILIEKIGLSSIREQCPHFSEWVGRLEALGAPRL